MRVSDGAEWKSTLDASAMNGLAVNDKRIRDGSDSIVISPMFEQISDDDLRSKWDRLLDPHDLTDYLRKLEDENRSKLGPRSIAVPWEDRRSSLLAYYDKEDHDPGHFSGRSGDLIPVGAITAVNGLVKSSTSGLPYLQRKSKVMERYSVPQIVSHAGVYPCMLYSRTQEEMKTRNVWGYPIADTVEEQRFFMPWLRYERALPYRSALNGPEAVDQAVTRLLVGKTGSDSVMSVDFSSFDSTITPYLSWGAFSTVASSFQASSHEQLYGIYRRFISIPIYTPEGEWSGQHGVPSGSSWTNTVDSLVQFQLSGSSPLRCQIQGDDGLYIAPSGSQDDLYSRFEEYGLQIGREKSDTFDGVEAVFLRRYYHPKYKSVNGLAGVYPTYRALERIKYLERWQDFDRMEIDGRDFFSLRAIMILENCKHHPAFEDLVKFVHGLDRDKLSFSNEGVKAYSRSLESRARAGVLHAQTFDKGLNSFETMKILRGL
jgi:hypothetical protein